MSLRRRAGATRAAAEPAQPGRTTTSKAWRRSWPSGLQPSRIAEPDDELGDLTRALCRCGSAPAAWAPASRSSPAQPGHMRVRLTSMRRPARPSARSTRIDADLAGRCQASGRLDEHRARGRALTSLTRRERRRAWQAAASSSRRSSSGSTQSRRCFAAREPCSMRARCSRPTPRRSRSARWRRGSRSRSALIGWHFFNPPTRMKLVEVIRGVETDPALAERAARAAGKALGQELGRRAERARLHRQPGRAAALRRGPALLAERVAEPQAIDRLMRRSWRLRARPVLS